MLFKCFKDAMKKVAMKKSCNEKGEMNRSPFFMMSQILNLTLYMKHSSLYKE